MKNAGICGFIKFLVHNNAKENVDYKIVGQNLYINKEYLKNNFDDIAIKYVDTMGEIFEETSSHKRMLNSVDNTVKILETNSIDSLDKEQYNNCMTELNLFADRMTISSKISTYDLLSKYEDVLPIKREVFDKIKKSKDLNEKYEFYKEAVKLVEQPIVHKLLIYNELLYGKFKLFFSQNSQTHKITCLCEKDKSFDQIYHKNFIVPLIDEFDVEDKKKNYQCIECMGSMKNKRDFTFLVDSSDDLNRKKSYYWNCKTDAHVCPLCAFIYTFIPLGFSFYGGDALFVNENSSIEQLRRMNQNILEVQNDGKLNRRVLRIFTDEKISTMSRVKSNVQVILCSNNYSHFRFDIIDLETIKHLEKGSKYLQKLENIKINFGTQEKSDWHYVYDMVFDCITMRQSFYGMIDKIMKHEFSNGFNYLKNILYLETIFYGSDNVDELKKKVDAAYHFGSALREEILGKEEARKTDKNNENDNKLRGVVYRLLNLTASGNCSDFLDTVIRVYNSYGLAIPYVFKDCYCSEEMFKAISHGFILGLKYVPNPDK